MKSYFPLLDAVRFFAAFWVMNFHYLLASEIAPQLHWYRYGNLGVQLFFIISGFVIVQSLKGKTTKEFAWNRFIRLFPLFWILCTLTYVVMLLFPDPKYTFYFSDYIRSMTMMSDVLNGFIGPATLIDPSYWTLTVELIFYMAIALYVHFFSYRAIRYFLLVWFLVSITAFFIHIDENFYVKLALVRHASYFIFGSALALLVNKVAVNRYEYALDICLIFASATFATYIVPRSLPLYSSPHPLDLLIMTVLNILFFLSIPILVFLSGQITNTRVLSVLAVLGGLTYPLYLLHQRTGNALLNLAGQVFDTSWIWLVIYFEVCIIAVAYVVYTQDKKFRAWIRGRYT